MFEVIPCVDIQQGRAVRLFEGDPERETVYFEDPLEAALHWEGLGAGLIHLVDLDAALGTGSNTGKIREIAGRLGARTELGGGIRTLEAALTWLETVDRVILGTAAQREPALVRELLERAGPDRVIVSVDARDGKVAVAGWQSITGTDAAEFAAELARLGLTHLIYTDVARDGTMLGVDSEPVARMRDAFPGTLVAGGGVGSDADLELYERLGLDGAIVGRALYEGRITYPRTA